MNNDKRPLQFQQRETKRRVPDRCTMNFRLWIVAMGVKGPNLYEFWASTIYVLKKFKGEKI